MSPTSMRSLLLVENNPGDALLLHEMFSGEGSAATEVTHVRSLSEAEKHLAQRAVDIIVLDLELPDAQGLGAVRRAQAAAPRIPLVVLTALDDEALAAQALQEGAQDYLVKGHFETHVLLRALRYAIERKVMEATLLIEKERAQVTLSCIGDAVACTDTHGRITYLNRRAEQLSGWSWQEAAGRGMGEVFRILDATSRETIPASNGIVVGHHGAGGLPSNSVLIRRDGVEIPIEDSTAPIRDSHGHDSGAVIVLRDVSTARTSALQVARSAQHDFLTGLPNRVLLKDRVNHVITLSQRHLKNIAVLFLDLDGFKHINDSLGHSVGDKLLQSVATRLVDSLRGSDTVSRQGGDEFIVLLSEVEHSADAAITARRMLKAVAESHPVDGHDLRVTASIGVSVYPDDGLDAETLIKNADTAMYQAKNDGRQRYRFFKPAMNVRAVQRQFLEEGLRRGLERNEFALHYQPKVNLRTGTITAVEALLRWTHPTRGLIAPAQFIPVAEDCGLIVPIGHWVLREAARQVRVWLDAGLPLATMAVNISGVELRQDDFLETVFAVLTETGLDPRLLELELTESALMKNADSTEAVLKVLRAKGVHLAIDDFGVGYSSLNSLKRFSIDTLKIDPSFVRQVAAPGDETTIVAAIINMAHSLKLRVVAEGVETQEELLFLQDHQCDEAQGYYFNRPVPPQQFGKLLETGLSRTILKDFVPIEAGARESLSVRARGLAGAGDWSASQGEVFGEGSVEHLARIDEMHKAEIAKQTIAHVQDIAERKTVEERSRLTHERLELGAQARTTAVAERKLADANAATEQSEASFRLLVNGVRDYGLYMLDPTGHVMSWNVGAERITGYKADEILGKHLAVFFEPGDVKNGRPQKQLLEAERTGRAEEEGRRVRKDGSTFWASVVLTPVCDANDVLLGFSQITHDLTERRSLEDQLQQSQKMEAVGSLAGGVAHDFNNLLSVVLSYSEMLAADLNEGDPLRAGLEEIRGAGWRGVDLTKQLLAFSRQQVLQPKVVDLNDIVTGMERMLRRLIGEDVDLTSTCASALGKVLVDPGQMEQVIMNLAVNARDAMPGGGGLTIGTAEVFLDDAYAAEHAGVKAGPHVVLSVSDTGIGIDKATQARMFEPFFTSKQAGKGTGLGLSTVFGIVKQSGGTVAVASEVQKGTTFKVYLPLANRVAIVRGSSALADNDRLHGSETILLVEDDERVRVLARTILRKYGYNVLEAQSGGDALLLCEQHTATIHLLLTDVVMPLMSGRQLAERLATMRPEMKVVYMSGYTNDAVVRHGILTSTIMFIQKPITPGALARKVREALGTVVHAEE